MENENKIEHLLRLCELQRQTLNARREIEWKICVAYWTAIIASTGYLLSKNIQIPCIQLMIFYIFQFIVFAFWLGNMFLSNEVDHYWIKMYKKEIHYILSVPQDETMKYPSKRVFLKRSWWWYQIVFTAFFLIASLYLLKK